MSIDHNRLCRDDSKYNVRYFDSERLLWRDPTDRSGSEAVVNTEWLRSAETV